MCNGVDDDCDVATADGVDETWFGDACDGPDTDSCTEDSFICTSGSQTCDDANANIEEVCYDGIDNDCDGATDFGDADCSAVCGDSVTTAPEVCDDGGESATCDVDCTAAVCGDGYFNLSAGEQCDDGNNTDGDGCSAVCLMEP